MLSESRIATDDVSKQIGGICPLVLESMTLCHPANKNVKKR